MFSGPEFFDALPAVGTDFSGFIPSVPPGFPVSTVRVSYKRNGETAFFRARIDAVSLVREIEMTMQPVQAPAPPALALFGLGLLGLGLARRRG